MGTLHSSSIGHRNDHVLYHLDLVPEGFGCIPFGKEGHIGDNQEEETICENVHLYIDRSCFLRYRSDSSSYEYGGNCRTLPGKGGGHGWLGPWDSCNDLGDITGDSGFLFHEGFSGGERTRSKGNFQARTFPELPI